MCECDLCVQARQEWIIITRGEKRARQKRETRVNVATTDDDDDEEWRPLRGEVVKRL